jgi:hypothetical protein
VFQYIIENSRSCVGFILIDINMFQTYIIQTLMQARYLGCNIKSWMPKKREGKEIESAMHG